MTDAKHLVLQYLNILKSRGVVWARSNSYKVKLNCGRRMKKGRIQVVP